MDSKFNKYVGIKWVKGGTDIKIGLDCWSLAVLVAKEIFGIEINDHIGAKYEGEELHQVINDQVKKYTQIYEPKSSALVVMYNKGIAEHVGICLDDKNILHSLYTSSSINNVRVLQRVFKKLEFYLCQK